MAATITNQQFHLFTQLHDELQITILSYIADAPFEERDNNEIDASGSSTIIATNASAPSGLSSRSLMYDSTLTHVLPFVSKKFYSAYSKSDQLWKDAILRQLVSQPDPHLWYVSLQNIIRGTTNRTYDTMKKTPNGGGKVEHEAFRQFINSAYQVVAVTQQQRSQQMSYQYLYRVVVNTQLRQVLPVFIMNGDVVLNESYGLHLFEYRYRYMMLNLIRQHTNMVLSAIPDAAVSTSTRAQLLQQYPVFFIHANRGSVQRSEMAVIAQVIQCDLHPDGRADIIVQPIHFCWIERSWLYTPTATAIDYHLEHSALRPITGSTSDSTTTTIAQTPPQNLFYAQVLKMGRTATNAMHYLQRQETLTNVMERLIASGIVVQDENGIHRRPSNANNVRHVHLDIFETNHDHDDSDDESDDQYM